MKFVYTMEKGNLEITRLRNQFCICYLLSMKKKYFLTIKNVKHSSTELIIYFELCRLLYFFTRATAIYFVG